MYKVLMLCVLFLSSHGVNFDQDDSDNDSLI